MILACDGEMLIVWYNKPYLSAKYVVYKRRLSYPEANTVCSSMSMELAMVKSEEENNELVAEASRTLGSPYLDRNFENVNQVKRTALTGRIKHFIGSLHNIE